MTGFDHKELRQLLERLSENQITQSDVDRLDTIVRSDRAALKFYVEYQSLHATLAWDTARTGDSAGGLSVSASDSTLERRCQSPSDGTSVEAPVRTKSRSKVWGVVAIAASLLITALVARNWFAQQQESDPVIASQDETPGVLPPKTTPDGPAVVQNGPRQPIEIDSVQHMAQSEANGQPASANDNNANKLSNDPVTGSPDAPQAVATGVEAVVSTIDGHVRQGWHDFAVQPSPDAEDGEWLRRVYLDLAGHIPDVETTRSFLKDSSTEKHARVVDDLLDDTSFPRFWAANWATLMIGRDDSRSENRLGLERYLRESFARNRGWNTVVADIVTAEGSAEQNGEAGFLLAHLNNQAVPATAITSRVLLGTQIHCTQCHDHPFNDWTQDQFWSFNSIFKQITTRRASADVREIVARPKSGATYYENLRGVMKAAFPEFDGVKISPEEQTDRRLELVSILNSGSETQIARAFVNRTWMHFMGRSFTNPVDDMGPHNPATHPELLSDLSQSFVASGYDVKQLVRWICNSEAYRLSSRFGSSNQIDDPDRGQTTVFSRVYPRSLSAEQVYDSLLVATGAHRAPGFDWNTARDQRDKWIQQFVYAHETDENDETTSFDGSITQALMMMNGPMIDRALSGQRGTVLRGVVDERMKPADQIETLCLAALSRKPSTAEIAAFRKILRSQQRDLAGALQDIFWAYLNSSEFVVAH